MTLQVDLPDDLAAASPEELRLAFAMSLYKQGTVSTGKAARVAGVSRLAFLESLGRFGIPAFEMSDEEFARDLRHADPDYGQ